MSNIIEELKLKMKDINETLAKDTDLNEENLKDLFIISLLKEGSREQ